MTYESLASSTQAEVISNPGAIGLLLSNTERLELVVHAAAEIDPRRTLEDVMSGLVMEGSVEWSHVRFPKLHRAFGRIVVGNTRYYHGKS